MLLMRLSINKTLLTYLLTNINRDNTLQILHKHIFIKILQKVITCIQVS